jgi:hypothetical protein
MTKDEAHNMSSEKIFLHMEARLAKALEETKKKYGEEAADVVAAIIEATMRGLLQNVSELPCPDPNHALLIGNVAGVLHRALVDLANEFGDALPTKVEMLRDENGAYTNQIRVRRPSGTYLITVEQEK